jgi:23S rRNA (cytosine1962-C5)-methyltransferase
LNVSGTPQAGQSAGAVEDYTTNQKITGPVLLTAPAADDYELIDAGNGQKLERFGRYRLVRPEPQAIWAPALPLDVWNRADAQFRRTRHDDSPGEWVQNQPLPEQWLLHYDNLRLWVRLTPFRHTGVFPEHTAHWEWMRQQLAPGERQPRVLVLFGYTGLSTLFAAQLGARVCHVDASRPAVRWAQANQEASDLQERPIRWIIDDVMKFVRREIRRGSHYDMIIMDPPVFGRGPKGEIWRLGEALPELLTLCTSILSTQPVGVLVNAYATNFSSIALYNTLAAVMHSYSGNVSAGELALRDTTAQRLLPTALYARWSST